MDIVPTIESDDPKSAFLTAATCSAEWQYEKAYLKFSEKWVHENSPEQVEVTIVHELLHAALAEMRDYSLNEKHEEHVAERLAKSLVHTQRKAEIGK